MSIYKGMAMRCPIVAYHTVYVGTAQYILNMTKVSYGIRCKKKNKKKKNENTISILTQHTSHTEPPFY